MTGAEDRQLMMPEVALGLRFPPPVTGRLALVGVTVVTLDSRRLLPRQTVIVEDGLVRTIGPCGQVPVEEAALLDCSGQYLMPGLADMHVHWWELNDVALYLANGVTTVRNMRGGPLHLRLQQQIAGRQIPGPRIITTSPLIDGVNCENRTTRPECIALIAAADAEPLVKRLAQRGYQQVKVYDRLDAAVLRALGLASEKVGLRMTGHCPDRVPCAEAIAAGMTCFEHLSWIATAEPDRAPPAAAESDWVRDLAEDMAKRQIWNCPTVVVNSAAARHRSQDEPLLDYEPRQILRRWESLWQRRAWASRNTVDEYRAKVQRESLALVEIVSILHEAGAPLLVGTDARNPFVLPGFAVHEELANLDQAGMTPHEVLQCATIEAARFLDEAHVWGTVTEGKRADLLLLDGNPLADPSVLRRPAAVFVNGFHLTRRDLDDLLGQRERWARQADELPAVSLPKRPPRRQPVLAEGELIEKRYGAPTATIAYRHSAISGGGRLIEEVHAEPLSGATRSITAQLTSDFVIQEGHYAIERPIGIEVCEFERRSDGRYEVRLHEVDGVISTTILTEAELSPSPQLTVSFFPVALSSPGSERLDGTTLPCLLVDETIVASIAVVVSKVAVESRADALELRNDRSWHIRCDRPGNPTVYQYRLTDEGKLVSVTETGLSTVRTLAPPREGGE